MRPKAGIEPDRRKSRVFYVAVWGAAVPGRRREITMAAGRGGGRFPTRTGLDRHETHDAKKPAIGRVLDAPIKHQKVSRAAADERPRREPIRSLPWLQHASELGQLHIADWWTAPAQFALG